MKIKVVLFDLDGTLLPMKQEDFVKAYFGGLAKTMAPFGYNPEKLIAGVYAGTEGMVKNQSEKTNEEVFWEIFAKMLGGNVREDEGRFENYYNTLFDDVRLVCGFNENAKKVVNEVKNMGYRIALATNPIFPQIATKKRIAWTGLDFNDFEYVSTYENSNRCKPNLDYYKNIIDKLGVLPQECLMVGNDVGEDMVAQELGMNVFLVTDCLINKKGMDLSTFPQGSLIQLLDHLKNINKD